MSPVKFGARRRGVPHFSVLGVLTYVREEIPQSRSGPNPQQPQQKLITFAGAVHSHARRPRMRQEVMRRRMSVVSQHCYSVRLKNGASPTYGAPKAPHGLFPLPRGGNGATHTAVASSAKWDWVDAQRSKWDRAYYGQQLNEVHCTRLNRNVQCSINDN